MKRYLTVLQGLGVNAPDPETEPPASFADQLDALHTSGGGLVAHYPMGSDLTERLGGLALTAEGAHETGLPALAAGGTASRGFNGLSTYAFAPFGSPNINNSALVTEAGTIGMVIQVDDLISKMTFCNLEDGGPGSVSLEILIDGQPRAFRRNSAGTAISISGSVGQIVRGRPYLYALTWGADGLHLYLMDATRAPGAVASHAETAWAPAVASGQDLYVGRWHNQAVGFYDGLASHLFWFSRQLTLVELESLAVLVQQAVVLPSFTFGQVGDDETTAISLLNRGHPAFDFSLARTTPNPTLGTAVVNGTSVDYTAGSTLGDDSFGVILTSAEGNAAAACTVSLSVIPPPTPVAQPDSYGPVAAGSSTDLDVLANDTDLAARDITIVSQPAAGSLTRVDNATASAKLRYSAPNPSEQTTYTGSYSVDGSNTANVSITVNAAPTVGDLPTAPSNNAYWVDPISGNDSATAAQARSSTSSPSGNPWRTLARAISQWNSGALSASASGHVEIILRGGLSYERGNNLTITRDATSGSHLVIKGYRNDISAGTRGGTGKFTGAKGWFVLRGNFEALESGGWEIWSAGRNIYRTTSTFSLTGVARAFWLGSTTHNLQLNPARSLDDLNTDNEVGVTTNPIYTAPGLFKHTDNRIYLRMETTQWTRYFDNYFTDSYYPNGTLPTWGTNPASEALAVFDETAGLTLSGVSYIDLAFFRAEYWTRGLRFLGNTDNCTCDFVHIIASVYCVDGGDAGTLHHIDLTHCDFVQNLPPWIGWTWVKENGRGIQAKLQGRTVNLTATYPHHLTIQHCRLIRGFDGGGVDNANPDPAPHDIIFNNNHLLWMRDDSFAFSTSIYNSQFLYNYHELCFAGYGRVGRPSTGSHTNQAPATVYFGFNILDLRRPLLRGRPASSGTADGEFNLSGTAALAENFGLQWSRMEVSHSIDNDEVSEHKYYHNLIMCGRDESNVGVWGWKDGIQTASVQTERYNNIVVNIENAEYHGRGETRYIEQDYNCYWGDPAGNFSQNKILVNIASGAQPTYATWAAFRASGANYNETKHANGDGPGTSGGWELNGKEIDPSFVNGKWESIRIGDLATYFPTSSIPNLNFAVSLTGTGWPGTGSAQSYVGPYAPGNAVTKIGPEQGLWVDD